MSKKLILHQPSTMWPITVKLVCKGLQDDSREINSQEEMNQLLEEVKLYNSENKNNPKRVISIT